LARSSYILIKSFILQREALWTALSLKATYQKYERKLTMKKIAVLPVQQLKTTSPAAYPIFMCWPQVQA
jgi:hypothetical protein